MQVGNAYDVHNDTREEEDGFSLILYVNDDFEGGELNFFHLNMEYKPVQGDIVVFPHPLYHSVNDVKIKNRYTIMISLEKFKDPTYQCWVK
jgi:Rps23 Pro-64 3,4-dihydroxylase Tpa1-like proline 4-hydroxylase